jgi:hypothetical protein
MVYGWDSLHSKLSHRSNGVTQLIIIIIYNNDNKKIEIIKINHCHK